MINEAPLFCLKVARRLCTNAEDHCCVARSCVTCAITFFCLPPFVCLFFRLTREFLFQYTSNTQVEPIIIAMQKSSNLFCCQSLTGLLGAKFLCWSLHSPILVRFLAHFELLEMQITYFLLLEHISWLGDVQLAYLQVWVRVSQTTTGFRKFVVVSIGDLCQIPFTSCRLQNCAESRSLPTGAVFSLHE